MKKITFDILSVLETENSTNVTINSKEKLVDQVFVVGRRVNDLRIIKSELALIKAHLNLN